MYKTKLIQILNTLSSKELKRFNEFLESPYFNKNTKTLELGKAVLAQAPKFKEAKVKRDVIFKNTFPNEKYYEPSFNNLVSDLLNLLEQFLAIHQFEQDQISNNIITLSELRKKGQEVRYSRLFTRTHKFLEESNVISPNTYLRKYRLAEEADKYFMQRQIRAYDNSLIEKAENLNLYYLADQLKSYCEMLNRQGVVGGELPVSFANHLIQYIENYLEVFENHPLILVYYYIYLTITEPENESYYDALKVLLKSKEMYFEHIEQQQMYQYVQNYCARKINAGKSEYLNELFELYKHLIINKIIFENNVLSHAVYKNIVSVGTRLKEFDWTGHFIDEYKDSLSEEYRENAYIYNSAALNYAKGNYQQTIRLLQSVDFKEVFYYLDAKILLMKTYFETGDVEPLLSSLGAYRVFLQRTKELSPTQIRIYLNFAKILKRIMIATEGSYSQNLIKKEAKLKDALELLHSEKNVANSKWLIEIIERSLN